MNISAHTKLLSTLTLSGLISFSLFAQPGSGVRVGEGTVLIPRLRLSYNYDDNVNLRRRATGEGEADVLDENTSDTFYEYLASLELKRFVGNRQLRANAWYGQDFYQSFSDLDSEKYGASAGYFWARPGGRTSLDLSALYEYAVDRAGSTEDGLEGTNNILRDFETVSERVVRDVYSFNAVLDHKLMTDLGTALIFGYYETDYEESIFNDRTSFDYEAELNYRLSDKTQPYFRIGLGIDEDEGFVDDAEKPFYLFGIRYTLTEKTRIDLAVGYQEYTRTPFNRTFTTGPDGEVIENRTPGEELTDDGIKYTANMYYNATSKTTFILRGRNGYDSVASSTASSRQENSVSLVAAHQTTRNIKQSFIVNWREDDYLSPITSNGIEYDELKETLRYQYRLNYQTVRPWLSFFGTVSYEDGSSNIPGEDYTQTLLSLGATLQY
jgi:hypothetical protein